MSNSHRDIWSKINSDEFEAALADNLHAFESAEAVRHANQSAAITCLGESHGSHLFAMSSKVLPSTGGLFLRLPQDVGSDLILDPGWGTLAAAHRLSIPLTNVGVILISHCHLDHVGDLHPLIVTLSLAKKRPILIGNPTSIHGSPGQPSILPDYFRNLCERVITAGHDEIVLGSVHIMPFQTNHRENRDSQGQSVSYIVSVSGKEPLRIGLLTDGPLGNLSEPIISKLRDCHVLIVNIGTISTQPDAPSHSRIFDNALCLHGLQRFLETLALDSNQLSVLAVTHLGAELLEVRSPLMREFLSHTEYQTPIDLLASALPKMVQEVMRKEVAVKVLREGNTVEV